MFKKVIKGLKRQKEYSLEQSKEINFAVQPSNIKLHSITDKLDPKNQMIGDYT